jgi:hypothetical protein
MARIVIHKAHHVVGHGRVVLDLAQQLFAGASGADDQDAVDAGVFLSLQKVFDGQLGVAHWVNRSRTRSATAALQSPLMAQFFPPLTALSFQLQALLLAFKTVIPTTSSSSSVRISTSSPISTVFFALCGFRKLK